MDTPLFSKLNNQINSDIRCTSVVDTVDSFAIAELSKSKAPLLVITSDLKEAERINVELEAITDKLVEVFPQNCSVPYNMKSPFGPVREARLSVLHNLLNGTSEIIIAPSATLFEKTVPPQKLFTSIIRISQDDELEISTLADWLVNLGFRRENSVAEPGSFAKRGGIVDIYPLGVENPYRVEFWGDTIDSIREFDIFKQKSIKSVYSIEILPMKEFLPTTEARDTALDRVKDFISQKRLPQKHYDIIEYSWSNVTEMDGIEWFVHWFDANFSTLLDYFPQNYKMVWNDFLSLDERYNRELENYKSHLNRVPNIQVPFVSQPNDILNSYDIVKKRYDKVNKIFFKAGIETEKTVKFDFIHLPSFSGDISLFIHDLESKRENNFSVVVYAETEGHAKRLQEQIEENGVESPHIKIGSLYNGFFSNEQKFVCYSESKIFDRKAQRKFATKTKNSAPIINYDALSRNDIVVHVDHGIGKYLGIVTIKAGGIDQDCMLIEYRDGAKIHVPITDFHKVQKYIGRDGVAPQLSKLGTSAWERKKEKTRRDLQVMANKLIKLYAQREFDKGVVISPDNDWQKEFEESFLYTPTPDQVKTMESIKLDLESEKPMDRLVCGDVGFGKTEVAMRAAFKAVMSGYQVAVLAPTTVLASQHVKNFRNRMANFPVKIAGLSRMTSGAATTKIKEELKSGELNIIIGTHKILSKTIKYKNLGLVIIDEEQRFGVKQKERFTELRHSINVLSMSATPIPRTLHMSMAGIRDLSLIATPPQNRLPIDTTVAESHDELIQRALQDELDRGGQAYIVYNRISGLDDLYRRVERLVPEANIAVAHGQMDGEVVDTIMDRFTAGEYQILISTTIIENGIDIANANTIIVEDADKLGLSQLYQLRGRVGRSAEQAYAYFLVKSFRSINEDSLKRLKALEQYTDLGSGFQLAMRDLELRGAGNLLGTDQSGSIATVGFELYCQLLNEEIQRLKDRGKEDSIAKDPELEIGLKGHYPPEYIADSNLRIQLYQRTTAFKKLGELKSFIGELVDRFGPIPHEVNELLLYMEIKILAIRFFIDKITTENKKVTFFLGGTDEKVRETVARFMQLEDGNFSMNYGDTVSLFTEINGNDAYQISVSVKNLLRRVLKTQ